MNDPDLNDDDVLLGLLRDALAEEDVPDDAVATALAAFRLRSVDEELAELVADSLVDGVAMRHDDQGPRQVTFRADDLRIELELAEDLVLGVLGPAGTWTVIVETTGGLARTPADELGRFRATIDAGRVRLHVLGQDRGVVTPWITR